ncbi:MAG: sulfate permease [Nitratireductor sp.]|nr:sulfate permease [Nitratireductor sp.]
MHPYLSAARKHIVDGPVARFLPILDWGSRYNRDTATNDLIAAVIVTIMLIPQSLAYALLAGLPAQVGLYASILPLVAYGIFGTSRTLAVGPVAVVSLMTAATVGELASQGTPEYYTAAIALAFLSGLMLLGLGFLRLGFLANFLSHPVISGFITASGIIIATSQVKGILGIKGEGHTLPELLSSMWENIASINIPTVVIGTAVTAFLFWSRKKLKPLLVARGYTPRLADIISKAAPVVSVFLTILVTWLFGLDKAGVKIVGAVPSGLPALTIPSFDLSLWSQVGVSALLISIVGFVESVSVAQTLAAKRRQRITPDQELIGLGASNIASAVSGGYPVTGGFARSVVNFDAGAETPAAGMFTAIGIGVATLVLTPLLFFLPKATLSATIIVAVLSLVDLGAISRTWSYSRGDGAAMIATIAITLLFGVERGILAGVGLSIFLHLYRSSKPHFAIVGQVPGTEHFRNVKRHKVATTIDILSIRVDESLYFANARFLEDAVYEAIAANRDIKHVVLMCPAVNAIDSSALESLEAINSRLKDSGVCLHLSEVKGPVMDRLQKSHFLHELTGKVFLTQFDALLELAPGLTTATLKAKRQVASALVRGK